MLSRAVSRARLGRAPTTILRTQTRHSHSTRNPPSKSFKYLGAVGAFSTPGLWWLTTSTDDVPHLGSPSADELSEERGISKTDVTAMISKGAYSIPVKSIPGISRYDGAQLASNGPCEDRFIHGQFPSPGNQSGHWMAWAVLDGHAGWQTADLLTKQLMPFVQRSLGRIESRPDEESVPEELIQRAIIKGFLDLDDSIVGTASGTVQSKLSLQEKVKKLAPAYAGSCALLSLYDPASRTLRVACTGDLRAVLGQQTADGKWEALPLSIDQTGSNQDEIARIYAEHPGEENIVKDGRVLGLMVSRAFGDGRWKWPLDFQRDLKERFNGPSPLTPKYEVQIPPYITAEPVVTSTTIHTDRPSFLILATDGMWDTLSSQQAVDLVGKWIQSRGTKAADHQPEPTYEPFDFGHFHSGTSWKFEEKRTTIQDENAAVHLVRNSLGGNHHELIAGRLAFGSPFSRRIRDDVTVQVVFFNMPGLKK